MIKPTIYIHHDAYNISGPHLPAVELQHQREKYPISRLGHYVFYQWFIERDGKLTHTRPNMDPLVVYKPAHKNSISVCLAGNHDLYLPSNAEKRTLAIFFTTLRLTYGITPFHIKEHRDYQKTSCPGSTIQKGYFALLFAQTQYKPVQRMLYTILLKMVNKIE